MAADYAGAVAAIKQRFVDNWSPGGVDTTPYGFVNEDDPTSTDIGGKAIPWVLFDIVSAGSHTVGRGVPGDNVIVYDMLIKGHVFVPLGTGLGETDGALAYAIAIGEIFRNKIFYNTVTAGRYVRSGYDANGQPRISDGDITSDDGEWFTVTATIPAEYWHRG